MQPGFQQPSAASGMGNFGLQSGVMAGMQQPAMTMGTATMGSAGIPAMAQTANAAMEGEQPVAAAQTAANADAVAVASQTATVGADKKFF